MKTKIKIVIYRKDNCVRIKILEFPREMIGIGDIFWYDKFRICSLAHPQIIYFSDGNHCIHLSGDGMGNQNECKYTFNTVEKAIDYVNKLRKCAREYLIENS